MPKYIALAGNIGAGKSSLVDFLCKQFDFIPFFEPNDTNPYIDDFYRDQERYAYHSQLYFLAQKFKIHQEMAQCDEDKVLVQDRTIFEDAEIFCANLYRTGKLSTRDFETYMAFYHAILDAIPRPDVLIFLDCPVRTLQQRIATRGRASESDIPVEYLRQLHRLYCQWMEGYTLSPVIRVNTAKVDYLSDFIERDRIACALCDHGVLHIADRTG